MRQRKLTYHQLILLTYIPTPIFTTINSYELLTTVILVWACAYEIYNVKSNITNPWLEWKIHAYLTLRYLNHDISVEKPLKISWQISLKLKQCYISICKRSTNCYRQISAILCINFWINLLRYLRPYDANLSDPYPLQMAWVIQGYALWLMIGD